MSVYMMQKYVDDLVDPWKIEKRRINSKIIKKNTPKKNKTKHYYWWWSLAACRRI